jgi:tRNA pseudouridine55 synthase
MTSPGPTGLCVVDKPSGWTSHDVVAKARGMLGTRKIGHAGTLDPLATGVLVPGVGRATRLLTFLTGASKTYRATISFGTETDSLDADGEVTATHPMDGLEPAAVRAAAASLTGDLMQVPPMVSAIKVDGRRLHQLAREGKEVERAPRPVTVSRFDVAPTDDPMVWTAVVDCSSGTYVRVLAADLGHAVGGGAHLAALRRTAVGPFTLDDAVSLEQLTVGALMAPSVITRVLGSCRVDEATAVDVGHGKVLPAEALGLADGPDDRADGPWAVIGPGGDLLAVYETHRGATLKPAIVVG